MVLYFNALSVDIPDNNNAQKVCARLHSKDGDPTVGMFGMFIYVTIACSLIRHGG